jgi:CO/xanthine dehydrogenase Mo-binding subunit
MIERMADIMAHELGQDPAQFRLHNFIKSTQFPYRSPTGWEYDSGNYHAALTKAMDMIGYDALRAEQADKRKRGELMGIGISSFTEVVGAGPSRDYDILGIKMLGATVSELPGNARSSLFTTSWIDRSRNSAIPMTSHTTCSAGSRRLRTVAVPVASSAGRDPLGIDVAAQILERVGADGGDRRQRVSKPHLASSAERVTPGWLARDGSAGRRVIAGPPAAAR